MRRFQSSLVYLLASLILRPSLVEGHGFLKTPRSRNWFAYENGVDAAGNVNTGKPQREYCSHCLNVKQAEHLCGKGSANTDYDTWNDVNGDPMPWISQETFEEGDNFAVDVVLTTNHAGHIELYLCPDGDESTQECLWSNPATLIKDEIFDGPVVSVMSFSYCMEYIIDGMESILQSFRGF